MSDSYQEYELACQQEKERNSQLLEQASYLVKSQTTDTENN